MKLMITLASLALLLTSCQKEDYSNQCINPALSEEVVSCSQIYRPVCGCDGETYSNACEARFGHGLSRYTEGACGCEYPYTGTVVDYSGLDGCGLMIELDQGDRLEPVKLPAGFNLQAGQRLKLNYLPLTHVGSYCMAGTIAHITCASEIVPRECQPLYFAELFNDEIWESHRDDISIKYAAVHDDCLEVEVSYGGGCEEHLFELVLQPVMCLPPDFELVQLALLHNDQGDACEALISETISFDLSALRLEGIDSLRIELGDHQSKFYPETLVYRW